MIIHINFIYLLVFTSCKNTNALIVKIYMGMEWMQRDFIEKEGNVIPVGENLVE
jgi:hypothetical protein